MARLILEEGGERRAFRFKQGKLTIGSSEGCTLTLKSGGVAEIHCDLEIGAKRVVLRARPGVQAPVVDGVPAPGETLLGASAVIGIGGATLRVDMDESAIGGAASAAPDPAAAPAAQAVVQPEVRKPAARSVSGRGKGRVVPQVAQRTSNSQVQRVQRRVSKGMPAWGVGLILAGIGLVGFVVVRGMSLDKGTGFDPGECIRVASVLYNEADHGAASDRLDKIDSVGLASLSSNQRAQYDNLRKRLAARGRDTDNDMANMLGTKWKATQLDRFRADRLHGANPPRERLRVYLKRVREFKERWPAHPEMAEVLRYETRFKEICDLSDPANFTDMAYEVKTMTWAMPRDYKGAFLVVERHLIANPGDAAHCNELSATMRTEQAEYFEDRMQQAKYHWKKKEEGQAVEWLVQLIIKLEDQGMAQQAANELVLLPGIDQWLKGYKDDRPLKFGILVRHPTVAAAVRELGV